MLPPKVTSLFLLVGILSAYSFLYSPTDIDEMIDKFENISQMPYMCKHNSQIGDWGCGENAFWDVVKQKERAIPFLLERLDDTTSSKAPVLYFGGNWRIGDIAYSALEEIINGIPTFDLMPPNFGDEDCGYCVYWQHLDKNLQHRINFKKNVKTWITTHKDKFQWIESNQTLTCECQFGHPNKGYFVIKN